jgi:hypothetical protein
MALVVTTALSYSFVLPVFQRKCAVALGVIEAVLVITTVLTHVRTSTIDTADPALKGGDEEAALYCETCQVCFTLCSLC